VIFIGNHSHPVSTNRKGQIYTATKRAREEDLRKHERTLPVDKDLSDPTLLLSLGLEEPVPTSSLQQLSL